RFIPEQLGVFLGVDLELARCVHGFVARPACRRNRVRDLGSKILAQLCRACVHRFSSKCPHAAGGMPIRCIYAIWVEDPPNTTGAGYFLSQVSERKSTEVDTLYCRSAPFGPVEQTLEARGYSHPMRRGGKIGGRNPRKALKFAPFPYRL